MSGFGYTGDGAQHIIGQRYFLGDVWRWPLLVAKPLRWPEGVNVIFTDSIPLILIPTKLFRTLLPPGFEEIHLWLAICWLVQPVAAVFALRSSGVRGVFPAIVAGILSISMPAMLWRTGHQALCAHFTILISLGVYFRIVRGSQFSARYAPSIILVVSLLIHPYLLAMSAAVLLAAPMTLAIDRSPDTPRAVYGFLASLVVAAAVALLLGYGGPSPSGGFGIYSMNLLSPFAPWLSSLFPGWESTPDATGGQYEGYNYLGAGLIVLCVVALFCFAANRDVRHVRRHSGLLIVMVGLVLFAVSNKVYAGHLRIASLREPPHFVNNFRSSGRFFWPVTYALLLVSIGTVTRTFPRWGAAAILVVVTVLQVADTSRLRGGYWDMFHGAGTWSLDEPRLRPLIASAHELTIWPRFECGAEVDRDPVYMNLLMLASEYMRRTNAMYTAHSPANAACDPAAVIGTPLRDGELRVILNGSDTARWFVPDAEETCRLSGSLAVCASDRTRLASLTPLAPLASNAPTIPLGQIMRTSAADGSKALALDWTDPAGVASWTNGRLAIMAFRTAPATTAPLQLTLWVDAIALERNGTQHVTLSVDQRIVAQWDVLSSHRSELHAIIPSRDDPDAPLVLHFDIARPVRPSETGLSADTRAFGMELYSYRVAPVTEN
jgi:hypothetical protein